MSAIKLGNLEPDEIAHLIPHRPILVGYRGSIAHGLYVAPTEPTGIDDIDILCVYIPDLDHYFGMGEASRGKDLRLKEWDCAAYEVRHFVRLLCQGNPNVTSLLWLDPESVIYQSREGEMLMKYRDLFASKRAYHSFGGYAHGQLKRMTSFKDVGPSSCGCEGKFHSPECAVAQERGRGSQKRFATGFMGEKRKGLVEKFGYDTKNAAHLMRILRLGIELLLTGTMTVDRRKAGDAEHLLAIKRGEFALFEVQAEAEAAFEALRQARDKSTLPDEPNAHKVSEILMDILAVAHVTAVNLREHHINMGEPRFVGTDI